MLSGFDGGSWPVEIQSTNLWVAQLLTLRCSVTFYFSFSLKHGCCCWSPSFRASTGSLWSSSSQEPHGAAPALQLGPLFSCCQWLPGWGSPFSGSSALVPVLHPFRKPGSEELGPETPSLLPPMSTLCSRTKDKSGGWLFSDFLMTSSLGDNLERNQVSIPVLDMCPSIGNGWIGIFGLGMCIHRY